MSQHAFYFLRRARPFLVPFLFCLCAAVLLSSCQQKKDQQDPAVVEINQYKITAQEYAALYHDANQGPDTPQARADFLNTLITRKLLLQEAQAKGFDKEKEFLKTIEKFWEQSLLKLIVDRKTAEIEGKIAVSEAEVRAAYDEWAQENKEAPKTYDEMETFLKWKLMKKKEAAELGRWTDELRAKAKIKINGEASGA